MKCEFDYNELSLLIDMVLKRLEIAVQTEEASIGSAWFEKRYALYQKIVGYYEGETNEEEYPETY